MKRLLILITISLITSALPTIAEDSVTPIRIGWIGPMSGLIAKFGSYQAVQIALEEINRAGGINGRPVELIPEDGKGQGKDAVSAAQKLINIDKVN